MKRIMLMVVIMISILAVSCFAQETDPLGILKKVRDTYKSLETYKSAGTVTTSTERDNQKTEMITSYSIILKKPNLYRVSSELTFNMASQNYVHSKMSSTIWSDGTQPYQYESSKKLYSKIPTDLNALGGMVAMSGGSGGIIIPTFFSSMLKEPWDFSERLMNVKLEGTEKVGDEECYVISADSKISKKEIFWISKTRNLIIKYSRSLELPEDKHMPEMSDEQIAKILKQMGQEVSEKAIKQMKTKMQGNIDAVKGFSIETQTQISSPELTASDFQFALPDETVLEESTVSH